MRVISYEEQFHGARLRIEQLREENDELRRALNKILELYRVRLEAEKLLRKLEAGR